MSLVGRTVTVLGAGRSGCAAAHLALAKGASVSLYDANPEATFPDGVTGYAGVTEEVAAQVVSDLVVVSPGIDTFGSFVAAFSTQASEIIGEMELSSRYYNGRIIAITGTNGKTTATELVNAFIRAGGLTCEPCGNYGPPLAEIVMMDQVPEFVALEVSSFQLETIQSFHPEVAVWMNFAPDHMDRYPDLESYKNAKLRIFENQTPNDLVITRAGEGLSGVTFSSSTAADYTLKGDTIVRGAVPLLNYGSSRLRGKHNAENVMVAAAVASHLGLSATVMQDALDHYQPPANRCELIETIADVEYVNDSKATNIHALESALVSQSRPIVLIAGGKEKGLDYSGLDKILKTFALSCVTYGEIKNKLNLIFSKSVPCETADSLEDAVAKASQMAPAGSMVLLSPGTSSFDQFTGYEARGDAFRRMVQSLSLQH